MLTMKSNRKKRELQRKNKIQQSSSALGNNPVLGRSRDGVWLHMGHGETSLGRADELLDRLEVSEPYS